MSIDNKNVKILSQQNLSAFEEINFTFEKLIVMFRLIYDGFRSSSFEDNLDCLDDLLFDNLSLLEQCHKDYSALFECLRNSENFYN